MNKTPLKKQEQKQIPIRDQILEKLLQGKQNSISLEQVREMMTFILMMLTPNQRVETLKKIERCTFFCEARDRGMETRRMRSIMMRKYSIDRRRIKTVCKPCTEFINILSNKTSL